MDLKSLRQKIDECDKELLGVLSERMNFAGQIGNLKDEEGAPIEDTTRDSEVLSSRASWASSRHLSTEMVKEIFESILKESKRRQKR
ncbi:chorismate mutase [Candidatus Kaiserbacteria bacterium]|nr:chorismate mutase [Candidatus Kaiserbacteria bacterium]